MAICDHGFGWVKLGDTGELMPQQGVQGGTMQIADLLIKNFRGIESAYIRFGRHTVFTGPNNCGKTTVIEALPLLFGRDRMVTVRFYRPSIMGRAGLLGIRCIRRCY